MPQPFHPATFLTASPRRHSSPFPARNCRKAFLARHLRHVLIGFAVSAVLAVPATPSHAQPTVVQHFSPPSVAWPFAAFVAEASQRFGIPAAWIRAVMHAESFGDVRAISPKGAMGLMQIMPETWAGLRQRYRLGADPYNAHDNIMAGAAYLRELHDRYGIPGFLAAYNAGPARWEDHLASGRPLPAETRAYLVRLAPIVGGGASDETTLLASIVRSWTEASLFPERRSNTSTDMTAVARPQQPNTPNIIAPKDWTGLAPQSNGLFVALSSDGGGR